MGSFPGNSGRLERTYLPFCSLLLSRTASKLSADVVGLHKLARSDTPILQMPKRHLGGTRRGDHERRQRLKRTQPDDPDRDGALPRAHVRTCAAVHHRPKAGRSPTGCPLSECPTSCKVAPFEIPGWAYELRGEQCRKRITGI